MSPRLQTIAAGRRFGDLPPPELRRAWRSWVYVLGRAQRMGQKGKAARG